MLFLGFKPAVCYDIVLLFGKGRWATDGIYQDRKLIVPLVNFAKLVKTGLVTVWSE